MIYKGQAWKFGDHVDTDVIIPARYLTSSDPQELGKHCLEDADPQFVRKIKKGDILVAGKNFGSGSSREHAPIALKAAGISCVIAKSFARIFYRNAFNMGLPILESPEASEAIGLGDLPGGRHRQRADRRSDHRRKISSPTHTALYAGIGSGWGVDRTY